MMMFEILIICLVLYGAGIAVTAPKLLTNPSVLHREVIPLCVAVNRMPHSILQNIFISDRLLKISELFSYEVCQARARDHMSVIDISLPAIAIDLVFNVNMLRLLFVIVFVVAISPAVYLKRLMVDRTLLRHRSEINEIISRGEAIAADEHLYLALSYIKGKILKPDVPVEDADCIIMFVQRYFINKDVVKFEMDEVNFF